MRTLSISSWQLLTRKWNHCMCSALSLSQYGSGCSCGGGQVGSRGAHVQTGRQRRRLSLTRGHTYTHASGAGLYHQQLVSSALAAASLERPLQAHHCRALLLASACTHARAPRDSSVVAHTHLQLHLVRHVVQRVAHIHHINVARVWSYPGSAQCCWGRVRVRHAAGPSLRTRTSSARRTPSTTPRAWGVPAQAHAHSLARAPHQLTIVGVHKHAHGGAAPAAGCLLLGPPAG